VKRRRLITGGLAASALIGGGAWLRPAARAEPHNRYFADLQTLMQRDGPGTACLVLDLDRLNHNLIALRENMPAGKHYRLVSKSLPCPDLIEQVLVTMHSNRIMCFHQPFANLLARDFPDSDLLLGKPMPVPAAERFYQRLHPGRFDPQRQLQWLVDTPARLAAYAELARAQNLRMRISIEIDVGLHRGGVDNDSDFVAMLRMLRDNSRHLRLSGFMGYDPHVVKLPAPLGSPDALQQLANARYEHYIRLLRREAPDLLTLQQDLPMVFNGAGSPNFVLHDERAPTNDLAIGSALLKPSDFELPTLEAFRPALWITTPVLKSSAGPELPGVEWAQWPARLWNPNLTRSHFIYGGNWMADAHSPAGLAPNPLFGRSSNQEMLTSAPAADLAPGDWVFLRPRQSEALMLQFGPLYVVQAGALVDRWPVFVPA
jgi:D-serine deaminase-like pyridoxal phosphate-dependent protein